MQLSGCGTALITPFRGDGSVDEEALVSLVQWQVESGVNFLVVCGTTGEAPTLSLDETLRVVELTIEAAGGRAPVLAGCTHNSTREAVARVRRISSVPNLSGILHLLERAQRFLNGDFGVDRVQLIQIDSLEA